MQVDCGVAGRHLLNPPAYVASSQVKQELYSSGTACWVSVPSVPPPIFFSKRLYRLCVFYMRSLRDFDYIDVFLICEHYSSYVPYEKGNVRTS